MAVIVGTNNADRLEGTAEADSMEGLRRGDSLLGREGADSLSGGDGDDTLSGGSGSDTYVGGRGDDFFFESGSLFDFDFISYEGTRRGVWIDLALQAQIDTGTGVDFFRDIEGVIGGAGGDLLRGGQGRQILYGGGGRDTIQGFEGDDELFGDDGADRLLGSTGDDRLAGGADADVLTGGDDRDVFVYAALSESRRGGRDVITDFERRVDRIDLSLIDANALLDGDQAFIIGGDEFSGTPGELVLRLGQRRSLLAADVDGDAVADFLIRFDGAFVVPLASDLAL